jgi:hypothetical protein
MGLDPNSLCLAVAVALAFGISKGKGFCTTGAASLLRFYPYFNKIKNRRKLKYNYFYIVDKVNKIK